MVLQQIFNTFSKIIKNSIFLIFLLGQSHDGLHELKPNQTSFRNQQIPLPICSWHRICRNESQIYDLEGQLFINKLCLLAKLSKRITCDCPNIADRTPRREISVNSFKALIMVPKTLLDEFLICWILDKVWNFRMHPVSLKTFSQKLLVIEFPLFGPSWFWKWPWIFFLLGGQANHSRLCFDNNLIPLINYFIWFSRHKIDLFDFKLLKPVIHLIFKGLWERNAFKGKMRINQRLPVYWIVEFVSLRRYHCCIFDH